MYEVKKKKTPLANGLVRDYISVQYSMEMFLGVI